MRASSAGTSSISNVSAIAFTALSRLIWPAFANVLSVNASNLRVSYGEGALLSLARMVLGASQIYQLWAMGRELPAMDPVARLSLIWPHWYPTTADDRQKDALTLSTLANAGQISRE